MLATLGGVLALVLGLTILLLPLVATELSRPRDSVWGAVVLLLGLVLVTSAERLTGAPMLGVLCGGLLIGRLGLEVGQARWRVLSAEEQQRLWSRERWQAGFQELAASGRRLLALTAELAGGLVRWVGERRRPRTSTKRWVRQELPPSAAGSDAGQEQAVAAEAEVSSLEEVDALLDAAGPAAPEEPLADTPSSAAASADGSPSEENPADAPEGDAAPQAEAKRDNPGLPPEEP